MKTIGANLLRLSVHTLDSCVVCVGIVYFFSWFKPNFHEYNNIKLVVVVLLPYTELYFRECVEIG